MDETPVESEANPHAQTSCMLQNAVYFINYKYTHLRNLKMWFQSVRERILLQNQAAIKCIYQ